MLGRDEAASLLRAAGVLLGEDEVAVLHRRTEGWPAGLSLAALSLREGGPAGTAAVSFGGADRRVSEYLEAEFLARISRRHRVFVTRTAVLERISGPLCDAVLDLPGSAGTLAELARSDLLLVPLDRRGQWYRYHHLFRDMLLAELDRLEPALIPVLRRRAATWYLRQRPARRSTGILHRRRGRRYRGPSGAKPVVADRSTGPVRHPPPVVSMARGAGRHRGAPYGRRAGLARRRGNGAAGRGRAVGRYGRSLAVRGRDPAR